MEGTLTESDNLNETCRRIGQTERKHDRVQRQEDEKELGSRAEPFDDDYSEAFGWRKTPDRIDGDGLLAIRLKQIGVHIQQDQVGWKLESGTAVRIGREEDAAKLGDGRGARQPILLKGTLKSDWEGTDWVAELKLEKISDKDYYLMMTGTVPFGSFNVDHRIKAEDVGHWWFHDDQFHRKPVFPQEPAANVKAEEVEFTTNIFKPKRDNGNRISKPGGKGSTARNGHTVSRLASSMGQKVTIYKPATTRKPASSRATPNTRKPARMESIPGNDRAIAMHKPAVKVPAAKASPSASGQPAADGPQQAAAGTSSQGIASYGSSLLSGWTFRGKSDRT